ncbi:hypothetical protein VNI00_019317 [Paramarasmius palmivorus]|uniref:Uncharacterized protein n=1 Tax=Paramarasmius palmivorus TaxID=297713 RepID=A0AAW0ANC9_9AGAR
MEANIGRGPDKIHSYVLPFANAAQAERALQGCVRSKLCQYLRDPSYKHTWFAVTRAKKPTYCQRNDLVAHIDVEFLSQLQEHDIVPAKTEQEAEECFQTRMGLYVD